MVEQVGVDTAQLVDLLTTTLFRGAGYSTYGDLVTERHYQPARFTTCLGRKDVHLALDAAEAGGRTEPLGKPLRTVLDQAIAQGHGGDDWASIAGLQRPTRA
ncbi:NAD-binding protein [Leucobacter allii]|uniref:NAD-binding protein n=1 Tax=Leucobacter allii TaxID=2932247 RepID=UPI001FD0D0A5|nr:NAD-binding protein [Leucobacter allii]UOR02432.1 NAD-binding protein [Leucobacter allii]